MKRGLMSVLLALSVLAGFSFTGKETVKEEVKVSHTVNATYYGPLQFGCSGYVFVECGGTIFVTTNIVSELVQQQSYNVTRSAVSSSCGNYKLISAFPSAACEPIDS